MNNTLISIIMPVYNAENYIETAINSIINQTYKNIELICIDDCSTDQSYNICQKILKKYKYKLLRNSKNMGQEYTRNVGLKEAKGKYFTFLDSDDTLEANTIEKLVQIAEKNQTDIVIAGYSKIINGHEYPRKTELDDGLYNRKDIFENILEKLPFDVISCIGSKLYNTNFIKKNKILFNKNFKYNEDMGFSLTALREAKKIYYTDTPFYKYEIQNFGTTMSSYRKNMYTSIKRVWSLMKNILCDLNIFESKQDIYYNNIMYLMVNSLMNEAKFSNYTNYKKEAKIIINDEDFKNVYIIKNKHIKYKVIFLLLKLRIFIFCYLIMKIFKAKKRSETVNEK